MKRVTVIHFFFIFNILLCEIANNVKTVDEMITKGKYVNYYFSFFLINCYYRTRKNRYELDKNMKKLQENMKFFLLRLNSKSFLTPPIPVTPSTHLMWPSETDVQLYQYFLHIQNNKKKQGEQGDHYATFHNSKKIDWNINKCKFSYTKMRIGLVDEA